MNLYFVLFSLILLQFFFCHPDSPNPQHQIQASAELSAEERIEQLRRTTEEMLTSRTEYVVSTRFRIILIVIVFIMVVIIISP